ncbi:MAG: ATP synthase F0 subunit A [Bacteroidetes bacterium 4572_112]|nr:MAG: ATP synthase F0 subunit A [Bacteroidetes bacterium 4572_112]
MILKKFWGGFSSFLTTAIIAVFLLGTSVAMANDDSHTTDSHTEHAEKKGFDAGAMIFNHVLDAHSWHVMDIGEHAISVPLPIIIYDQNGSGFHFFMSSRFEHGHAAYDGYKLLDNKIVRESYTEHEVATAEGEHAEVAVEEPGILDFSITKNVVALFVSSFIIFFLFVSVAKTYKRRKGQAPSGVQNFLEPIILFIRDDIAKDSIGHKYEKYMPYLLTIFFFILINNLMGLVPILPGGANLTGNISVTLVLAMFTFVITTFSANKNYWVHIINMPGVPWWLKFPLPLMPLVEIMGVFTKPFVLMVRLFANITAGHIVILGFMSMIFIFGEISPVAGYGVSVVSVAFSLFLSILEILVAFIQAYVFTLLSALYFGMAMEEEH